MYLKMDKNRTFWQNIFPRGLYVKKLYLPELLNFPVHDKNTNYCYISCVTFFLLVKQIIGDSPIL